MEQNFLNSIGHEVKKKPIKIKELQLNIWYNTISVSEIGW